MKGALYNFVDDIKKAVRYYFLGAFSAIRSNLLCRTPAQKDFTAIGARAMRSPVL